MSNPKTRIERGKALENYISQQLKAKGIDCRADRSHGSGNTNREKADIWTNATIFGRNLGIEAKNHKTIHIPDWWKQTQKLQELGREPVLAYRIKNKPYEETLVTIYLDTFLDMVAALQGVDDVSSNLVENYNFDKTTHLNSLKYIKDNISRAIREYEKKILKEE